MLIFHFNKSFSASAPAMVFHEPERLIIAHHLDEVMPALNDIVAATAAGFYAAGFLTYEAASAFDTALKTAATLPLPNNMPLLWFGIYKASEVSNAAPGAGLEEYHIGEWQPDTTPDAYAVSIKKIRESIRNGDIYQANFTLRLQSQFSGSAEAWFEDLRRSGTSSNSAHGRFNAFLDIGSHRILSLSPELFFSWDGCTLRTRPMKGTAKRVAAPAQESADFQRWQIEDIALADGLLASTKNRAENLMIVDLLRNDVSRVAKPGTVAVPHLFTLETYPTLYQMTSTVIAETRENTTIADIFKALFPCGSITGAPKIKSSEVIADRETSPRGVYCGALGFISPATASASGPSASCVFNVPIRTIVIDVETGAATCGVGGGIVWDSETRDEYAEAMAKAAFMQTGSHGFELLETLRLENGLYAWLARHLARLLNSALALGFAADEQKINDALHRHAELHTRQSVPPHHGDQNEARRVRLLLSRGGEVTITSESLIDSAPILWRNPSIDGQFKGKRAENERPARRFNLGASRPVVLAKSPVDRHDRALHHKTTRRAVYDMHRDIMAQHHPDAFDVLLWNQQRELTEFSYGSLVLQIDGEWLTPRQACGLLPGVLRAELLAHGEIVERVLMIDDLQRAQSIWFINSVRGWVKVSFETPIS